MSAVANLSREAVNIAERLPGELVGGLESLPGDILHPFKTASSLETFFENHKYKVGGLLLLVVAVLVVLAVTGVFSGAPPPVVKKVAAAPKAASPPAIADPGIGSLDALGQANARINSMMQNSTQGYMNPGGPGHECGTMTYTNSTYPNPFSQFKDSQLCAKLQGNNPDTATGESVSALQASLNCKPMGSCNATGCNA